MFDNSFAAQQRRRDTDDFIKELDRQLAALRNDLTEVSSADGATLHAMTVSADSDTAPNDDTTTKKLTVQRLSAAPTNAAYIEFSNSPGAPGVKFYLVLEEG